MQIKFFLFAHRKTILNLGKYPCCFVITKSNITFENGAKISISFITNLEGAGVRTAPTLQKKIREIENGNERFFPKYEYPPEVLTFSPMEILSNNGVDFKIESKDLYFIRGLDNQKAYGKTIFGGGFLMSETATKQLSEIKEKAQEENSPVMKWQLSDREREIVKHIEHCKKET